MKAVRFGFLFLITMVMIRLLTVITYFNPEMYWISPLYALIELLINLNLDEIALILFYIIYPSLFRLPWVIIYIYLLISNSKRSVANQRIFALSILGLIGVIVSVGVNIFITNLSYSGYDMSTMILLSTFTGIFSLIFIIVILILPNYGYLKHYKIFEVGGFVLNNLYMLFIFPILAINSSSPIILTEAGNLFFSLFSIMSFYYLMKYLESETGGEFSAQNYMQ